MGGTDIVEVTLPDGEPLLVQAQRIAGEPSGPPDVGLRRALEFSAATSSVRGAVAELHSALQAAKPDAVSIEIDFDFAVRGSQVVAFVVDTSVTASVKMRLERHSRVDPPSGSVGGR